MSEEQTVIREETLDNGLRVVLRRMPCRGISIYVSVGYGTLYENSENFGANHFIEHLIFKKSRRHAYESIMQLARRCEDLDAKEGVIDSKYWAEKFLPEKLDFTLDVLSALLFGSMFRSDELEIERDVILIELGRTRDNLTELGEENHLQNMLRDKLYKVHPIRFSSQGSEETIRALNRDILWDLYKTFYVPNNMVVSIAGCINEEEALVKVVKYFGRYKSKDFPSVPKYTEPKREKPEIYFEKRNVNSAYLMLGVRVASETSPDWYPMRIIEDILGGNFYSRLFYKIREERGLAYDVDADLKSKGDEAVIALNSEAGVEPSPEKIRTVRDLFISDLERLRTEKVLEEELAEAKQTLIEFHLRGSDECDIVAGDLCRYKRVGLPVTEYDKYPERIMTVTQDDILRVARRYFDPRNYAFVGVIPNGMQVEELHRHLL